MGFKQVDVARALEQTSFHFGRALLLLLNGLGANRANERARRRARKTAGGADCKAPLGDEVLAQCSQRARSEFNFDPRAWDLGQHAGSAAGACFWCAWQLVWPSARRAFWPRLCRAPARRGSP